MSDTITIESDGSTYPSGVTPKFAEPAPTDGFTITCKTCGAVNEYTVGLAPWYVDLTCTECRNWETIHED